MSASGWETVIGLEIHAQLATKSKIFSGSATAYGSAPNSQANLVDLAYPGVLPVLNHDAVRMAVKFGLAIGAAVAPRSVFARNLPVGLQICGPHFAEAKLLNVAHAYQKETDWHRRLPVDYTAEVLS